MSERDGDRPHVEPLDHGRLAVRLKERTAIAYAVADGNSTWVWLDGSAYQLHGDLPEGRAGSTTDQMSLAAPMPATVRSIAATIGQNVTAGDVLVVLEAMKMELALKAPRAGTVRAVRCHVGELVQPGLPLVELE